MENGLLIADSENVRIEALNLLIQIILVQKKMDNSTTIIKQFWTVFLLDCDSNGRNIRRHLQITSEDEHGMNNAKEIVELFYQTLDSI